MCFMLSHLCLCVCVCVCVCVVVVGGYYCPFPPVFPNSLPETRSKTNCFLYVSEGQRFEQMEATLVSCIFWAWRAETYKQQLYVLAF